jgi:hypothetical protein
MSFAKLLAATRGWQSTLSAAIAGLLEDGLAERSGSAFGLTSRGHDLVRACRRTGRRRSRATAPNTEQTKRGRRSDMNHGWPFAKLKEIADKTAKDLTDQVPALEKQLAEISDQLDLARAAAARAEGFDGICCPDCWIRRGKASHIAKMPDNGNRIEKWRCFAHDCRAEFQLNY